MVFYVYTLIIILLSVLIVIVYKKQQQTQILESNILESNILVANNFKILLSRILTLLKKIPDIYILVFFFCFSTINIVFPSVYLLNFLKLLYLLYFLFNVYEKKINLIVKILLTCFSFFIILSTNNLSIYFLIGIFMYLLYDRILRKLTLESIFDFDDNINLPTFLNSPFVQPFYLILFFLYIFYKKMADWLLLYDTEISIILYIFIYIKYLCGGVDLIAYLKASLILLMFPAYCYIIFYNSIRFTNYLQQITINKQQNFFRLYTLKRLSLLKKNSYIRGFNVDFDGASGPDPSDNQNNQNNNNKHNNQNNNKWTNKMKNILKNKGFWGGLGAGGIFIGGLIQSHWHHLDNAKQLDRHHSIDSNINQSQYQSDYNQRDQHHKEKLEQDASQFQQQQTIKQQHVTNNNNINTKILAQNEAVLHQNELILQEAKKLYEKGVISSQDYINCLTKTQATQPTTYERVYDERKTFNTLQNPSSTVPQSTQPSSTVPQSKPSSTVSNEIDPTKRD